MLDRAFRTTLRSLSTLFLVVAVVTIPFHLVYGFIFQSVIATRDIHQQISEFPNYRQVRNVGPRTVCRSERGRPEPPVCVGDDLTTARAAYWGLMLLELALIPLVLRATRRVLAIEEDGGVATVPDAWRHVFARNEDRRSLDRGALPALAVAAIVAFVLGFLIEKTGLVVVEAVSDEIAWVAVAVVQGAARAVAAPFALTAFVSGTITKEAPLGTPKLY